MTRLSRTLLATVLSLSFALCPALASANCGPAEGLDALGYRQMLGRGKIYHVQRMSRRQLKAMTEVRMKNQLFGFAR